jgi:hypothetical protein
VGSKYDRDYIEKHRQIRDKLIKLARENECPCFDVAQLASQVGMDVRTIRAHLKIMQVDAVGVFMDPSEKQFCTKEGIALLANMLKLDEKAGDSDRREQKL